MADLSYTPKVYRKQGGDELVVASSGKITVESGGLIDLSSATGAITFAAGEIDTADIADDAITSSKIADDAVTSSHLADDAVGSSHIQDSAVLSSHIADDAVNSSKIADEAVLSSHIADLAVNSSHLASSAVLAAAIASSAVIARHLTATLRHGVLPLNLYGAKVISSTGGEWFSSNNAGFVTSATNPSIQVVSTADRASYLQFSSGAASELQLPPVPIPADFSTAEIMKVKLLAARGSTLDTGGSAPMLTAGVWFNKGDTELSSNTARLVTEAGAPTTFSVTFSSGDLAPFPGVINVALTSIASTNDPIQVYAAWLDYTRTST